VRKGATADPDFLCELGGLGVRLEAKLGSCHVQQRPAFCPHFTVNMESRDPTFCREFISDAKLMLARFPDLKHRWSIDDDEHHCLLEIPPTSADGFIVTAEASPEEITVGGQGYHHHFSRENSERSSIHDALGFLYDLLSAGTRIRERLAGGSPYKWDGEVLINGTWVKEGSTSLVFWNYLGKRSERFYQNNTLPTREKMVERSS
jgi:hypothetical protein